MIYKRVRDCVICQSSHASKIDRDLLNRVPFQEILENRVQSFTDPGALLSLASIEDHWDHMKRAVDAIVDLVMEQAGDLIPKALHPGAQRQSPASQAVFNELVHRRIDEIQVMEDLVLSGMDDLKNLTPKNAIEAAAEDSEDKDLRNRVRKDTATITIDSARVKQMAAQTARAQEYAERGRLVFRMFDLFRMALDSVPDSIRGTISSDLKAAIGRDGEIKELLTAHTKREHEIQEAEVEIIEMEQLPAKT